MRFVFKVLILILSISYNVFAQDPLTVVSSGWQRTVERPQRPASAASVPARAMTTDDKNFQRNARNQRTDNPLNPEENSVDARSAALERAVQESRTPKADDVVGYHYTANVRNDSGKTIEIVFWEYRFAELARPENVVRRQFLCSMKLKKGDSKELSAFSQLGPTEVIDVGSLAKPGEKIFDEKVIVNRVELADGAVLQRNNWKYEDVKKSVERVTSTPWGREICRAL
ncbi:MAG: hypothetical protein ABI791_02175 [Acidobacteriota bacterium]